MSDHKSMFEVSMTKKFGTIFLVTFNNAEETS